MSRVTSVVLITATDDGGVAYLAAWVATRGGDSLGAEILKRAAQTGGGKWPQVDLYAAGWNYFQHVEGLIARFRAIDWDYPENVVLIISPEEGATRVVRPPSQD